MKIELPPKTKSGFSDLPGDLWDLMEKRDMNELLRKIDEEYYYWDKVKHQPLPKGITGEDLWGIVKRLRDFKAHYTRFGKYHFKYNLTGYIQREVHHFDLNIGGNIGSMSPVSESEKNRYLISSIMEEAIASSQIEGAVTTRKKAKEMLRKNISPKNKSEQMILNNYITIRNIVEHKEEKLTPQKLLEIHKLITNKTLDNSEEEGRFRQNDDVSVVDAVEGDVVYSPPSYKEVSGMIKELCDFINEGASLNSREFIHPIIKGCIIHFMIGFIHPFVDGNGRTARALFYWYLLSKGYWLTEYLSISRLIIKSKEQYAKAFLYTEVDENDLNYFIHYKLKTMHLAFDNLNDYINRKQQEKKQVSGFQKIKHINERQALILGWLVDDPDSIFTVKEIETRLSLSNQTARNDLTGLVKAGLLRMTEVNKKKVSFSKSERFEELVRKFTGSKK